MKIELTDAQTSLVMASVAQGRFATPEAAIEQALEVLALTDHDDEALKAMIAEGDRDIAAGKVIDISQPGSLVERLKAERSPA